MLQRSLYMAQIDAALGMVGALQDGWLQHAGLLSVHRVKAVHWLPTYTNGCHRDCEAAGACAAIHKATSQHWLPHLASLDPTSISVCFTIHRVGTISS
eukprot:6462868-Amphidinium_carterae.4